MLGNIPQTSDRARMSGKGNAENEEYNPSIEPDDASRVPGSSVLKYRHDDGLSSFEKA